MQQIYVHKGDLPEDITFEKSVAVDTETTGLDIQNDRICLVQLADDKGNCHLVQIVPDIQPLRLMSLLSNPDILKIFHFARFDVAMISRCFGTEVAPIYCTKIAHRLVCPEKPHGLKDLCAEFLGVSLDKAQQCSDWTVHNLSDAQKKYAAADVLYLHKLRHQLDAMLVQQGRQKIAASCFDFIPVRAKLDLYGYKNPDIFEH